jgi:tetratricopeptide (TPR) repeat protein
VRSKETRTNMRGNVRVFLFGILIYGAACSHGKPGVATTLPQAAARLADADQLLRQGCFDCIADALREYEAIGSLPGLSQNAVDLATIGWIRAAVLLGLRERELGTTDEGYLSQARQKADARDDLRQVFLPLIDAAEALPSPIVGFDMLADGSARRRQTAFRERIPTFLSERRTRADVDPLSAYAWVAFTCAFGGHDDRSPEVLLAALDRLGSTPLVSYRVATCFDTDTLSLTRLLERDPRFKEVSYWLGQQAISERRLDDAEKLFALAYTWRARWPAVTAALANLYFAFEEPDRALEMSVKTLDLVPGYPEAMLGRVKALSVLGRHDEAFAMIDLMIGGPIRILPAEAYYWRAWNGLRVGRFEAAWVDIEQASESSTNSKRNSVNGSLVRTFLSRRRPASKRLD